ncbi:MAG: Bax inhibitor-1/YccA family protein [Candidatus Kapaibacterium sp.]|nr:MAG: Bax inhibitor-1/YccA family protein [Candidatus Kapabacteria bacterium]
MSSFGRSQNTNFRQQQQGPRYNIRYKTSNPILSERRFASVPLADGERMTIDGTANKVGFLLLCCLTGALFTWSRAMDGAGMGFALGGAIVGFIFAIVTSFKPEWSAVTAPIYSVAQGLFIGGVSAMMEMRYPGIALQAAGLTFGVFFSLLFAYKTRLIRVTETFRSAVMIGMMGLMIVYLVSFFVRMFTGYPLAFIHQGGVFGIIFSLVVIAIAAANLLMDFDFIESVAEEGAPKYMEWFGAFGLMVTLVWLYIEILRLLAKLRDDD